MATVFTALPTVAIFNPHRPARPMKSTPWANGWPYAGIPSCEVITRVSAARATSNPMQGLHTPTTAAAVKRAGGHVWSPCPGQRQGLLATTKAS